MTIEIKYVIEIAIIVLTLKLIASRWQPPVQESVQAIICIVLGTAIGLLINPTKEGFIAGIIASGVAFYGGDLTREFRTIKNDLVANNIDIKKLDSNKKTKNTNKG